MPTPKLLPPAQPTSPQAARAWLAWARAHAHPDSCQCHGCLEARRLLRDALPVEPNPSR